MKKSLILLLSFSSLAQTSVDELAPIHVEDTLVETGMIDAPVKVEVLSGDEIKKSHHEDLSEAIKDIPGITTTSIQSRVGGKSALIQGLGENSVLVMIDGVPVSQNSSFGFDLSNIATDDIEKVEVIKGGASALYGSQAIGGVINIVTKRPTKKAKYMVDIKSGMVSADDNANKSNISANFRGQTLGLGSKISVNYRTQDAYDLDSSTVSKDGTEYKKLNASAFFNKKFGAKNEIFTSYNYFNGFIQSTGSKPMTSSSFGPVVNTTDGQTQNLRIGHIFNNDKIKVNTDLVLEKIDDEINFNDIPKTSFNETLKNTDVFGTRVQSQLGMTLFDSHAITLGALVNQASVDQKTRTQLVEEFYTDHKDIDNKKITSIESFAQDNFFIGENLEVSPGIRFQNDSDFGSHTSPKINLSYYSEIGQDIQTKSWATIGTGYRVPTIKERFFSLDHTAVANYIVVGNENLLPETSLSLQLGQDFKLNDKQKVHANLFYNKVDNMIETIETEGESSTRVFTYENLEEVTSKGVEIGSTLIPTNNLTLKLHFTYTETKNDKTGLYLANRPLYISGLNLKYDFNNKLSLINRINYKSDEFTDTENTELSKAHTIVDLKANYKFSKSIDIYLGLDNIFNITRDAAKDEVVPSIDNRPSQGRYLYAGLTVRDF